MGLIFLIKWVSEVFEGCGVDLEHRKVEKCPGIKKKAVGETEILIFS